jgi:threonine synthase
MARLFALAGDVASVRRTVRARAVSDDEIRDEIAATHREHGRVACPHTATALRVLRNLPASERESRAWVVVATAHPAKFETIVEPIVVRPVDVPPALAALLDRPARVHDLEPRIDALVGVLERGVRS